MNEMHISPEFVIHRLEEAANTMRRLPAVKKPRLQSYWPDIIHDWSSYGYDPPKMRRTPPGSRAISRMDACLEWLRWLEPGVAKLVWMRAERVPWKVVCRVYGAPKTTAWRHWTAGILTIQNNLLQKIVQKPCEMSRKKWNTLPIFCYD